MFTPPKTIFRVNVIPIKIPMTFCKERKKNLKIYIRPQKTQNGQIDLEKEQQS